MKKDRKFTEEETDIQHDHEPGLHVVTIWSRDFEGKYPRRSRKEDGARTTVGHETFDVQLNYLSTFTPSDRGLND